MLKAMCKVMNILSKDGLKDLKDVESHVQSDEHRINFKAGLSSGLYATTNNCTCKPCGISFHNCIALEVHWLMPLHRKEKNEYLYPKLNELLKQVSGLPGEELAMYFTPLCSICDVQLDSLDAYIMHLFMTSHITRVRYSECVLCSKTFSHAENREAHLVSSKHVSALQKWRHGFIREGCEPLTLLTKGGYPCMVCMIWCSSWLCLELHLLYVHHADALQLSNKESAVLAKVKFILPANTDDDVGSKCDISRVQSWKEWRGSALKEHAWCHVCGIPLPNLDVVNEHLKSHEIENFPATLPKKHVTQQVLECSESPKVFSCCLCALSFKSALMLSAHMACMAHHSRLVVMLLANAHLICCANCGVVVDKEDEMGDDTKCVNKLTNNALASKYETEATNSNACNCMHNACHVKEERPPIEYSLNTDVSPFPLFNAQRLKQEKDADISQARIADGAKKKIEVRCNGKSIACPDEGEKHSGTHVFCGANMKIPVVTAAALVPIGALQQSMQSMTNVVAEALLKSLQRFMQSPAKRKLETDNQLDNKKHYSSGLTSAHPDQIAAPSVTNSEQKHPAQSSLKDVVHSNADTEKADVSTTDDKSVWQEFLSVISASALSSPLPDLNAWIPTHAEAMLTNGKQETALENTENACRLMDEVDDIKMTAEQSVESSQCHSEKLDEHQTLQTSLMHMHSHDNEIVDNMKEGLGFKAREQPSELIIELHMAPPCIKSEKLAVDGDDSLNVSNNLKDAEGIVRLRGW